MCFLINKRCFCWWEKSTCIKMHGAMIKIENFFAVNTISTDDFTVNTVVYWSCWQTLLIRDLSFFSRLWNWKVPLKEVDKIAGCCYLLLWRSRLQYRPRHRYLSFASEKFYFFQKLLPPGICIRNCRDVLHRDCESRHISNRVIIYIYIYAVPASKKTHFLSLTNRPFIAV